MLLLLFFLALGLCCSATTVLTGRQENQTAIQHFIFNVAAAGYAAQIATEGEDASTSNCRQTSLASNLDAQGINGTLAKLLTCELAVGIIVFPDPNAALTDLQATLSGLKSVQNHRSLTNSSQTCNLTTIATLEDAGLDGITIWNLLCNTTTSPISPLVSSAVASISANISSAASAGFSLPLGTVGTVAASASIGLPLTGSNRSLTLTPASGVPATAAGSRTPTPLIFSSVNASAGISISTNGTLIAASSFLTAFPSSDIGLGTSSQGFNETGPVPASRLTSLASLTSPTAASISPSASITSSIVTTTSVAVTTGTDGILTETVVVWEYVTVWVK